VSQNVDWKVQLISESLRQILDIREDHRFTNLAKWRLPRPNVPTKARDALRTCKTPVALVSYSLEIVEYVAVAVPVSFVSGELTADVLFRPDGWPRALSVIDHDDVAKAARHAQPQKTFKVMIDRAGDEALDALRTASRLDSQADVYTEETARSALQTATSHLISVASEAGPSAAPAAYFRHLAATTSLPKPHEMAITEGSHVTRYSVIDGVALNETFKLLVDAVKRYVNASSITPDVTVRTIPEDADVTLKADNVRLPQKATNCVFQNVWLSFYHAKVTKSNYKDADIDLNLVDDPQTTLVCRLVLKTVDGESRCHLQ
jgi:hypothetical protein